MASEQKHTFRLGSGGYNRVELRYPVESLNQACEIHAHAMLWTSWEGGGVIHVPVRGATENGES